jgi:hypothetical protein
VTGRTLALATVPVLALAGGVMARGQDSTHAQHAAPNVTVVVDRNWPTATREFKFAHVPSPSSTDAATTAKRLLIDGEIDPNGATLAALTDGLVPREEDEPGSNLFFNAGTNGGSFRLDLGSATTISQINSYSWHPSTRGPQVYVVYGSDGTGTGFDPAKAGWTWIANVDTRGGADMGGQYGVSISSTTGALGRFQYLLFVCSATETDDDWGNTFYSEIDVIAKAGH